MKKSILLSVLLGLTILFSVPKVQSNLEQKIFDVAPIVTLFSALASGYFIRGAIEANAAYSKSWGHLVDNFHPECIKASLSLIVCGISILVRA